ncbi:MAG: M20 family metallopeptidase [Phycisphaerales bacterium]|nr:M20 family metallopeptidase [Phycisphaerales bacterium]
MNGITELVEKIAPEAVALRHDIHAHPELGYEEHQTAQRILDQLRPLGRLDIRTGVAKTGIVAVLNADKAGPCVALRTELDALPIEERTGLSYASKHPGKMHACGHDGHMACLVGAVKVLTQLAEDLPGSIKFIFQPAEEFGAGGDVMCKEGVLDDPKVDAIFALHGWPDLELGHVGVREGAAMASADQWKITVHGVGGHAAYPHRTVDPVVVASHIVVAAQTIASRSTDPLQSVVVTVASAHAGTAHNIIPETAELTGTIRALTPGVRAGTLTRFKDIVKHTAAAFGATADVEFGTGYPVLVNDDEASAFVNDVARDVVGSHCVPEEVVPCMGGEDFAFFAQRVPAAFWRLGVRRGDPASQPNLHQPTYDFPDEAVPVGIRMHCEMAMRYLNSKQS